MRGHVRRRKGTDDTWIITVDFPRSPDGRRNRHWETVHGTRSDADRVLRRLLRDIDNGTWREGSLTVWEFAEGWLDTIKGTVEESTWRSYESHIRLYVNPAIGNELLTKVNGRRLSTFYARLTAEVSVSTVHRCHATVRRLFRDATRWDLLAANPADAAVLPKKQDRLDKITVWDADQLYKFLEATNADRWWPMWVLFATTGVRRGEALGLQWGDVDLSQGSLRVERQRRPKDGVKRLKTQRSRRTVSLAPETVDVLKTWRATLLEEGFRSGWRLPDDGLVFVDELGTPPHPDSVTHWFTAWCRKLDLPEVRLHDLRHSHATELLRQGEPPKVVSERLGHAGIQITLDTYTHFVPELHRRAGDASGSIVPQPDATRQTGTPG